MENIMKCPVYMMGSGGYFLREKQMGHETDHLLPYSVEVKNTWSYTSTPR